MKTSNDVDAILEQAKKISKSYKHAYVSTEHFLLAMFKSREFVDLMLDFGVQL